jgi:hypothetical protein
LDVPYRPEDVEVELRLIFEQLREEFGAEYEIWRRVDNFGLWLDAGVLNPARRAVAGVQVMRGRKKRTEPLNAAQLSRIRDYLSAGGDEPFGIEL